jgi:hypothetical protein
MDPNPLVAVPLPAGAIVAVPLAVMGIIVLERRASRLDTPRWASGFVLILAALLALGVGIAALGWPGTQP